MLLPTRQACPQHGMCRMPCSGWQQNTMQRHNKAWQRERGWLRVSHALYQDGSTLLPHITHTFPAAEQKSSPAKGVVLSPKAAQ